MIDNENLPDIVERAELDAEARQSIARRTREGQREATAEKWDRMNAESIARGDGELPF